MIHQRYTQIYEHEEKHWWYAGRRLLLTLLIHRLNLKQSSQILDIGCGTGLNLSLLSRFGEVYGVDKAPEAIRYCHTRGFFQVIKIDGENLPYKNRSFDLITCLDVLEHIKNESIILRNIRQILKPGGYLIIFVPAFTLLWSDLDVRSQHYRRYSLNSLHKLLKENGFLIKQVSYFNYLYFLPILFVRMWQKTLFGKKTPWGIDPHIKNHLVNQFLKTFFYLDVWSAPILHPPFGVSLYTIATLKKN